MEKMQDNLAFSLWHDSGRLFLARFTVRIGNKMQRISKIGIWS